jgi:WD40 repeat protein
MDLRAFPISPDAIIRDYPPEAIAHSPNREYLAYVEIFLEDGRWKSRRLRLLDVVGHRHDLFYWSVDWQWVLGWVDDDRLAIAIPGRPDGAVTVLNPFTGQWNEIWPEFPPPAEASILYPRWTFPVVVFYDPTLTYVAYPIGEHGEGVVLYDLQADSIIWEGKAPDRYWVFKSHTLGWSPDGNNLAVVVQAIDGSDQLILVDHDGTTESLLWSSRIRPTSFSIIEDIAWSPDGKFIAAWLRTDVFGDSNLVLIDVETQTVFDLCISTAYDNLPIWSPDGSQLAVEVREEYSTIYTLIIDLKDEYAVKVVDNLAPVGWLVDSNR